MQTILLIENAGEILNNLKISLEMEGYNVLTASTGKKSIEVAAENMPDLIICDVSIPETGGYDVLNALKASHKTATIPFVLSISDSKKTDKNKALEFGVDDFIVKPFDMEVLSKTIRAQIRRARNLTLHI